jgi:hypothetical protein
VNRAKSKAVSTKEPDFAETVSQAAGMLGIGERGLYRWLGLGAPGRTKAGYDIAAIKAWRGANLEPPRRARSAPTGDAARLLCARANEREAVAKLRELEFQIESGKYILASRVEEHDLAVIALVTRALDEWTRSLPVHLVGIDERGMFVILQREAKALRTRMARMCSLAPTVETPEADRKILEAETVLDFATELYAVVFGEPPPRVACRGEPLTQGREIVEAAMAKIRSLKEGGQHG